MQTIRVNINKISQPAQVLKELRKKKLRRGATVTLVSNKPTSDENWILIIMFLAIALTVLLGKKKDEEMAEQLIKDLLKDYKSADELERKIEKEYSVNIEMEEAKGENEDFGRFAMQNLARAYDDDEPDLYPATLSEPKPTYKGWKKGK